MTNPQEFERLVDALETATVSVAVHGADSGRVRHRDAARTDLLEYVGRMREAVLSLLVLAEAEQQHWWGRDATQYWKMNGVILAARLALAPEPVPERTTP